MKEFFDVYASPLIVFFVVCREVRLNYLDVYDVTIQLPYPVFDKKGTAKFEKAKKVLILTLPVKPALVPKEDKPITSEAALQNDEG